MVRALRALGCRAAAGNFRGGRERPPYNSPQMGAGKRNVGRKGKVFGFACRLPCIAGRAISPAGQHSDGRKVCGTVRAWNRKAAAAGNFRGGRERPPYNPPQMGAGKRNVSRKGKVPGFACRLLCIVGRAISPAGQHSDGRKVCGTVRAWNRKAAAAGNFRGGRERPPYNLPGTSAKTGDGCQENRSCRREVFFISTASCFAGRAISPAGQHSAGRKLCGTMRALPAAKNPPTASKGRASIPDFQLLIFKTGSAGRRRRRRAAFWAPPCAGARRPGG